MSFGVGNWILQLSLLAISDWRLADSLIKRNPDLFNL